ncbi:flagellar biosynthetic protein FliO [Vreelandella rituensis]|uniref:Flagellar protein n=1 Tax=Vreelandella rituensis TaxID=2282306 RepID=A0A368TQV3_9GAMM|nr:flagellar biosynthetic protein FliO [Halomonas rituensis]RCV86990.1 flagellar biosynthetic protein FliO [Halomonas rituensis]
MSAETPSAQDSMPLEALGSGSDALLGMATLGKTAAALALVIAIILACTALLRRWNTQRFHHGAHIKIVGTSAVGNRERVVVVQVEDTWLVLGVGSGRITKLHELPVPERQDESHSSSQSGFSQRLAQSIKSYSKQKKGAPNAPSDSRHTQ